MLTVVLFPIRRIRREISAPVTQLCARSVHLQFDITELPIPLFIDGVIAEHVIRTRFFQRGSNGLIKVVAIAEVASAGVAGNRFKGIVGGESLKRFAAQSAIGVDAKMNPAFRVPTAEARIS